MKVKLCNVALAVPLRNTFTYRVPDHLVAEIQAGSRVVVPFRKKSLVGVVTEWVKDAPPESKLRDIQKRLDVVPALTPALIELGRWIASYYLAPIGEVYRAMLPPVTELSAQQIIVLSGTGRRASPTLFGETEKKPSVLQKLQSAKDGMPLQSAIRSGIPLADLLKLQRRGCIEIRQQIHSRKRRMRKIIAWKGSDEGSVVLPEKEQQLRHLLLQERGPLPLDALLKISSVSRALIEQLLREGKIESWEEALDPAEDPF